MTIYTKVDPADIIDVIYTACMEAEEISPKMGSKETALEKAKQCDVYAISKHGEVIGTIIFNNNCIHIAVLKDYHGKWLDNYFYHFLNEQYEKRGDMIAYPAGDHSEEFIRHFSDEKLNE